MLNIFKRIKQQQEEIEELRTACEASNKMRDIHLEWDYAYSAAINELRRDGVITNQQAYSLLNKAVEIFNDRQSKRTGL